MTRQPTEATRFIMTALAVLAVGDYTVFDKRHDARIRRILTALQQQQLKCTGAVDLWGRGFRQRRVGFAGITVVGRLK
jgi:hypothetical protein